ncbi:MAG: hypothetical protein MRECE_22c018 [Mycoplasmataceae bacterium CE_OT135]|nr:MAG: hypothetical protein MRECE_22c018 [Mycoplasmataceae bacterium CE_OT135]
MIKAETKVANNQSTQEGICFFQQSQKILATKIKEQKKVIIKNKIRKDIDLAIPSLISNLHYHLLLLHRKFLILSAMLGS